MCILLNTYIPTYVPEVNHKHLKVTTLLSILKNEVYKFLGLKINF